MTAKKQSGATQCHIVLLRGINVGGHNKVKMADLKARLSEVGFVDPVSKGVAGNLVMGSADSADKVAALVGSAVSDVSNIDIAVIVRSPDEVRSLVADFPWSDAEPKQSGVVFLDAAAVTEPDASVFDIDECQVATSGTDVFVNCRTGFAKTKLTNAWVEKQTSATGTRRNHNTVVALVEMAEAWTAAQAT